MKEKEENGTKLKKKWRREEDEEREERELNGDEDGRGSKRE